MGRPKTFLQKLFGGINKNVMLWKDSVLAEFYFIKHMTNLKHNGGFSLTWPWLEDIIKAVT